MSFTRHIIILFLSITFISIGYVTSIEAATYYVDNQSNGNGSGTSMANAWKSFSAIVWSQINPGDTIYISGGNTSKTYRERLIVNASGSSSAPITIAKATTAGHDGEVIIDGEYSRGSGISIQYQDYITVRGLSVRGSINSGGNGEIYLRSSIGSIIEECSIEVEKAHGGVHLNGYPGGNSGNIGCIVRNNTITTPAQYCTGQTDGIYSQLNTNNIYEKNSIIIRNTNEVQHCDCIQSYQDTDTTVRSNFIQQDNSKGANSQGIFFSNAYGMTKIYNNVCIGMNTTSSMLKFRDTVGTPGTVGFYNNIVLGGQSNLLQTDDPYTQLFNNIFVTTGGYTLVQFGSGVTINSFSNMDNNIMYNPVRDMAVYYQSRSLSMSAWKALGADPHGSKENPNLDTANNLLPQNTSLVAGTGTNLSYLEFISDDIEGTARPTTGAWSIGAYELQNTGTTIPKVEGLEVVE